MPHILYFCPRGKMEQVWPSAVIATCFWSPIPLCSQNLYISMWTISGNEPFKLHAQPSCLSSTVMALRVPLMAFGSEMVGEKQGEWLASSGIQSGWKLLLMVHIQYETTVCTAFFFLSWYGVWSSQNIPMILTDHFVLMSCALLLHLPYYCVTFRAAFNKNTERGWGCSSRKLFRKKRIWPLAPYKLYNGTKLWWRLGIQGHPQLPSLSQCFCSRKCSWYCLDLTEFHSYTFSCPCTKTILIPKAY